MSRFTKHLPPLETLITFEAVGRHGSFTHAATELCVTQSAVSKQIRNLESSLKVTLFERQPRGIELTLAGTALYAEVGTMLERLQRTVIRLRAVHHINAVSVIATHAMAQFWMFPKLMEFNKAHPEITVNIHALNEIDEANVAEHDFGVLYGAGNWSSLQSEWLLPEVVYPVASRDLDVGAITTLEELAAQPLIQLDSSAWDCIEWRDWFLHFGILYSPRESDPIFNQLTLAYRAIQQGMGIGLAWNFMADDALAKGELQRVGNFEVITGQAEYLVHARHRPLSPAAKTFRDWLIDTNHTA